MHSAHQLEDPASCWFQLFYKLDAQDLLDIDAKVSRRNQSPFFTGELNSSNRKHSRFFERTLFPAIVKRLASKRRFP